MLESIPDEIDLSQEWLVKYWAESLGISQNCLGHCVALFGNKVSSLRKYLNDGHRIAITTETGESHLVARLSFQKDGFGISVPYHSARHGMVMEMPIDYGKTHYVAPISDGNTFTVEDTVKLSFHLDGFVQFSQGGQKPIVSGYNAELAQIKGVGLKAPDAVNVSTGPLFGIILQDLSQFRAKKSEIADVFSPSDMWHHPRFSTADDTAYSLEAFMFPNSLLPNVLSIQGKRIFKSLLPFTSSFGFPFDLRVVELPHQPIFLGFILSHIRPDGTNTSGYKISGPGCRSSNGQMNGIFAWYPRPYFADEISTKSLNYNAPIKES